MQVCNRLAKNVENNDLLDSEICTHSIYGLFKKTCQLITLKCAQCLLLSFLNYLVRPPEPATTAKEQAFLSCKFTFQTLNYQPYCNQIVD